MNPKLSTATFSASLVLSLALLGCSTPPLEPVALAPPPPEVSLDLPLERPEPSAAVCKLGTSCLELDPRPFEACLVGTKHCVDKATEAVEVRTPQTRETQRPMTVSLPSQK